VNTNLQPVWYVDSAELKQMLFPEAAKVWLATRTPYIAKKTFHEYELNIRVPLSAAFGQTKLGDIDADQIRAYQQMRLEQHCGPSGINHECSVLQQMLKRVALWAGIQSNYKPMHCPRNLGAAHCLLKRRICFLSCPPGTPIGKQPSFSPCSRSTRQLGRKRLQPFD
jgi:hypothetical protein